jgi:hypothetical protein
MAGPNDNSTNYLPTGRKFHQASAENNDKMEFKILWDGIQRGQRPPKKKKKKKWNSPTPSAGRQLLSERSIAPDEKEANRMRSTRPKKHTQTLQTNPKNKTKEGRITPPPPKIKTKTKPAPKNPR